MRVQQAFITPLERGGVYGSEVEVSDYVRLDGLSKIKRSIDSTDYSVGVYTFSDLRIKCENARGTFNEHDSRSIFPFTRDRAKLRIVALLIDANTGATVVETQFQGIIDDSSTRQNITTNVITMVALSKDSIFRTTQVPAGIVSSGTSAKNALLSLLSLPSITALMTVSAANINPEIDFTIDNPAALDDLEVKAALDLILAASSSALMIKSDVVYIHGRENPSPSTPLELRGRGEITNNANIISVSSYASGKQRQFNSVSLNDKAVVVSDSDAIAEYGLRQIEFSFPMITNIATLQTVGRAIFEEFRYPKIELKLRVPTGIVSGHDLLDLARVDAPWLRKPKPGDFLPVLGVATLGDVITPLPRVLGSVQILDNVKFKIISIEDDLKTFITILKLRQAGRNFNDGVF